MRLRPRIPTVGCCTRREIGPVGVEDEASRCTMEAANENKEGGTEVTPTATRDPPETGGVEAMRTDRERPSRSAGKVARKATEKASAGRSTPFRRELDPETGSARTTPKIPGEPETGLSS